MKWNNRNWKKSIFKWIVWKETFWQYVTQMKGALSYDISVATWWATWALSIVLFSDFVKKTAKTAWMTSVNCFTAPLVFGKRVIGKFYWPWKKSYCLSNKFSVTSVDIFNEFVLFVTRRKTSIGSCMLPDHQLLQCLKITMYSIPNLCVEITCSFTIARGNGHKLVSLAFASLSGDCKELFFGSVT